MNIKYNLLTNNQCTSLYKCNQLTYGLVNIENQRCIKFVWSDIFTMEALKTR